MRILTAPYFISRMKQEEIIKDITVQFYKKAIGLKRYFLIDKQFMRN